MKRVFVFAGFWLAGCGEAPSARSAVDALQDRCEARGEELLIAADQQGADLAALDASLTEVHNYCLAAIQSLEAAEAVRVARGGT